MNHHIYLCGIPENPFFIAPSLPNQVSGYLKTYSLHVFSFFLIKPSGENLASEVKQHRIGTTPSRACCGLCEGADPGLLNIHFADLLGSQFIAFNSLAAQQLLLFCCISSLQLGEVGQRGDEIIVPGQAPQVDEHVQGVGQDQQQDQGQGPANQNGWREGRGTVSGLGKLSPLDGKALVLSGEREELK